MPLFLRDVPLAVLACFATFANGLGHTGPAQARTAGAPAS